MPGMFVVPTLAQLLAQFAVATGGLVDLLVGNFLNMVVHRLPCIIERKETSYIAKLYGKPLPHPKAYNLIVPRSACPSCGHQIEVIKNIPILSWSAL